MPTLCLFSSYFEQPIIPNYIKFYLEELSRHADDVWLLSNQKQIDSSELVYLKQKSFKLMLTENKGYDFGQWYRAIQQIDMNAYDRLILANDSCVLIKSLDQLMKWCEGSGLDYAGLSDSLEISYHPQSYFLHVNKRAIPSLVSYFMKQGDAPKTQSETVHVYEIGLASYLHAEGLSLGAMINYEQVKQLSSMRYSRFDPCVVAVPQLMLLGSPLIKRRYIMGDYKPGELLHLVAGGYFVAPSKLLTHIQKQSMVPVNELMGNYRKRGTRFTQLCKKIADDALSRGPMSDLYQILYERNLALGIGALFFVLSKSGDLNYLFQAMYWLKSRMMRNKRTISPFSSHLQ
jgi:lipopolysaccharide biosynthesis protein